MAAYNIQGKIINVGDAVTIIGVITALSSTGENTVVTVQPPLQSGTFLVNALNILTPEGISCGPSSGNQLTVGNDCTTKGVVTAISGSGNTATLSVLLSTQTISIVAGACYSDNN